MTREAIIFSILLNSVIIFFLTSFSLLQPFIWPVSITIPAISTLIPAISITPVALLSLLQLSILTPITIFNNFQVLSHFQPLVASIDPFPSNFSLVILFQSTYISHTLFVFPLPFFTTVLYPYSLTLLSLFPIT